MGAKLDLTGYKFGSLTYIKPIGHRGKAIMWLCECACGNYTTVGTSDYKKQKSCSKTCIIYSRSALARLTGMWKCEKHGNVKAARKGNYYACSVCTNEASRNFSRADKLRAVDLLGGQCVECGFDEHVSALDFHHIDPTTKDFGIAGSRKPWAKIERELKKCIILCARCHRKLHLGEYEITALDHLSMSRTEKKRMSNIKIKRHVVDLLGGQCVRCGYNDCIAALDFHHIDPNTKEFTISQAFKSWSETKLELKKCVILCCNCHRMLHAGYWNLADLE